jgi:uncharacterized protein involved in exopolysaccharide biosynthesis
MLREAQPVEVDDRLDLIAFINLVSAYRWTVILTTAIFTLAALSFALLATPLYRAEATLTIVKDKDDSGEGGGGLGSQLGDIANLAGVNLGSSSDEDAMKAVLNSRNLVRTFIERYHLLPALKGKAPKEPTLWKATGHFHEDLLSIKDDQRKGTTTVAITWTDPVVAARWVNDFVALANELIRTKALNESQRNVDFLTSQANKTSSVEVQHAMYQLLESETKKLMLANERIEYAFSVADPGVAPEIRSFPKRTLIVGGGLGVGLFVGLCIAFVRGRLAVRRQQLAA